MLQLFIKDNTTGHIHEYGTDKHDSLILQEDGSLHYEHMQSCVGTKYPEEGFSFCLEDGTIPEWDLEHGVEPYIDIAGEYYTKPKSNADRIQEMEDQAPQPLSIDELRQMIGQPVWVTHQDGSGGRWGIVNEYSGSLCADVESGQAYWFENYIGTVAYRQRPLVQEAAP